MDAIFKEKIIDYRKRMSSVKARDCVKETVQLLH
jgi:hypothetical protein